MVHVKATAFNIPTLFVFVDIKAKQKVTDEKWSSEYALEVCYLYPSKMISLIITITRYSTNGLFTSK